VCLFVLEFTSLDTSNYTQDELRLSCRSVRDLRFSSLAINRPQHSDGFVVNFEGLFGKIVVDVSILPLEQFSRL